MTTETTTPVTETLPPELQYLKDRGEDISEFLPQKEGGETGDLAAPATEPAKPAEQQPKDDDTEPGEVVVGDDGRIRDAKGKFVPKAAYMRQSERAKGAETELGKLREELAIARTKLELAGKAPTAQPTPAQQQPKDPFEEPDVDPQQDLIGWAQQQQRRTKWQAEQHTKATQDTQAALTEQNIYQAYRDDTSRFVAKQADYPAAFKHVVESRARELIALGMTDREALTKQIRDDEAEIVRQAVASRRSPAEVFYALAVAKGYQAPQAQQQPQAAPAAARPAGKTAAETVIDNINAGQATGKTLTGAGAGSGAPGLTVEQYLAMSVDDIIAFKKTPGGMAQLREIGAA